MLAAAAARRRGDPAIAAIGAGVAELGKAGDCGERARARVEQLELVRVVDHAGPVQDPEIGIAIEIRVGEKDRAQAAGGIVLRRPPDDGQHLAIALSDRDDGVLARAGAQIETQAAMLEALGADRLFLRLRGARAEAGQAAGDEGGDGGPRRKRVHRTTTVGSAR